MPGTVTTTLRTTAVRRPAIPAHGAPPARRGHVVSLVGPVVAVGALIGLLTLASARAVTGNSDGATVVLQGRAMASGNLLLNGWRLSVDSFWTVDALFYAVAVGLAGVRSGLVHVVPAAIAALIVVVGVALARDGRRGAAAGAGSVTVLVLVGFPSHYLSAFLLAGPIHDGTALWALVAFYALRRGRWGAGWVVGVVFLAAGMADLQIVGLGIVPVLCAGLVTMARHRSWRRGAPLVAAAPAAVLVAGVVRAVAVAAGTYSIGAVQNAASFTQLVANLGRLPVEGAHLLGVGGGALGTGGVPGAVQDFHVVGLGVVVVAVVAATGRLVVGVVRGRTGRAGDPLVDDLLVLATAGGCVTFVALAATSSASYDRYLTAAVVFASILAGREVARVVALARRRRHRRGVPGAALVQGAAVVAVTSALALAVGFGISLDGPPAPTPAARLVSFLEARHLDRGLGDYWSASITTVVSDGQVVVRPVVTDTAGEVVPYGRQSSANWYRGSFQFLVYTTVTPSNVNAAIAAATFGPPAATYAVGRYRVLVWGQPVTGGDARPPWP